MPIDLPEKYDKGSVRTVGEKVEYMNSLWLGDAIEWLKSLDDESIDLVFANPPYNIKKAEWDTFESQSG